MFVSGVSWESAGSRDGGGRRPGRGSAEDISHPGGGRLPVRLLNGSRYVLVIIVESVCLMT